MLLYYAQRRGIGGAKVLSIEVITATITIVRLRQAVS
jgi:hypothetical protein